MKHFFAHSASRLIASLMLLCCAALISSSCGRKGPPKPPENFAPQPVRFFSATGTIEGVLLQWAIPEKKADGDPLDDLEAFVVWRAIDRKGEDVDFEEYTELEYEKPEEEEKEATPPGEEEIEKFSFLDTEVAPGERYVYYLVAKNEDGVSGLPSSPLRVTFIGEASQVELYTGSEIE